MQSKAKTPTEYINSLPEDRKTAVKKLRSTVKKNLPEGFSEMMCYGMLGYVVPHSLYPKGYHCNPAQPLPFINIASQKNYIALYHMGLYADKGLLTWFTNEYKKCSKTKLDMGKSCIRFKKADEIPYDLIGKLAARVTPAQWVKYYTDLIKR